MKTRRPNFRALQAFEAVARLLSVSRAAEELGITQSAVSHQLRLLTEAVGEKLLMKQGRGIALTPTGLRISQSLQRAFMDIDRSMSEAIGGTQNVLRLAICSSFAPGWLIPRLGSFYQSNPGVDLKLIMCAQDPDLTDAVADAFVTVKPVEIGFHSLLICPEMLVPVAAPSVVCQFGKDLPLVTTDMDAGRIGCDWLQYARLATLDFLAPKTVNWLFASHYIIARDMAVHGFGAALVPDFLVEDNLQSGKLVLLDQGGLATGEDYYLSVKESRRREPAIEALLRWFRREVAKDSLPAHAIPAEKLFEIAK